MARRGSAVAGTAGVLMCGVLAPAASAHDALVGATPASGASVAAPSAVKLSFSAAVLSKPAPPQVVVTDAAGKHFETGCASVLDAAVTSPVSLGKAGTYRVQWRVVSSDGHPVSGEYTFTSTSDGSGSGRDGALNCAEGAAGSSTDSSSASAAASSAGTSPASSSAGSMAAASATARTDDGGGTNAPLVMAGVAAALAVVAGAVMIARSRRR